MDFFNAEHLKTDIQVEIHVQDSLPPELSSQRSRLPIQADKNPDAPLCKLSQEQHSSDVPIDRRLYRSLAAHEVGHALGSCNFAIPNPSIQAKEYVAYITMFATMDAALRARILKASPGLSLSSVFYACFTFIIQLFFYLNTLLLL